MRAAVFVCALVLLAGTVVAGQLRVGGLGEERPVNDEVRSVVSSVSKLMESKYPTEFSMIEPVSYKTQIVAGMNYFVKAFVTEKSTNQKKPIHMRIYRPIQGPNQLTAIKTDVDAETPLIHFQ